MQQEVSVCASHPLQSGPFCSCDWRVQHVARAAMPTVWWGLRRSGCALCLFSCLKITVTNISFRKHKCQLIRWSADGRPGSSEFAAADASCLAESSICHGFDHGGCCFPMGNDPPSINNCFSFFICFSYANRNCWGNHKNWLVSLVWIRIVPYHAMTFSDGEWLWFPSLVWIRGVPGLNHLVFLEVAFQDDVMGLAAFVRNKRGYSSANL